MENLFEGSIGKKLRIALLAAVVLLGIFLALQALAALVGLRYIGAGIIATNTIVVSGHGEAFGVPDIATFDFSVVSDKPTVAAAQADATKKINAIINYLTGAGVAKADIQTSNYSVQPQYQYQQQACPNIRTVLSNSNVQLYPNPCPPGKQILTGYEVNQSTTVKVRDITKAGDLLTGVGSAGATQVSGLTLTFDNPHTVQDAARNNAITDAKSKADTLAKSLGISLVRVVAFSENTGGGPIPMAYSAGLGAVSASVPAPVISPGQTKVTDDVSITYEIR